MCSLSYGITPLPPIITSYVITACIYSIAFNTGTSKLQDLRVSLINLSNDKHMTMAQLIATGELAVRV